MRRLLPLFIAGLVLVVARPAAAAGGAWDGPINLTFPVAGPTTYTDSYSAPRSGGRVHQATDVMAEEGTKVHAAVGGTVTWMTGVDSPPPSYGYMLSVAGDDGRTYHYVHLGRQDGPSSGAYAPGVRKGGRVDRGQWIGLVGCSGNASCSGPHLHFSIDDPDVTDPYGAHKRNPYASLRAAQRRGDIPGRRQAPVPVVGDWNGDGRDSPGWFQPGRVRLRHRAARGLTDEMFRLGQVGDVPVVGDWDGDGVDTVGVRRGSTWLLRNHNEGPLAIRFRFGRARDLPLVGDWDGDGDDTPGLRRGRSWRLSNRLAGRADVVFSSGRARGLPVTGDWDGDGKDEVATRFHREWSVRFALKRGAPDRRFPFGGDPDRRAPVAGDWDGDGDHGVGTIGAGQWRLRSVLRAGRPNLQFRYP